MAPTTANQRPARHAFNKAVRGVIGQTNGGDATMKDVTPASGPVRRVSMRKKHTVKDAMQVEHAAKISKLASRIGPSKLSVTGRVAASKASPRLPAHEMWREFVKARYNADAQFLDLSRLSDDAVLKKYNLAPPGLPGKTSKTGAVVFKLASQLKPPPVTVSLAHNGLTSTSDFQTLSHYLPGVRNLSLEGNALKEMRDIEPFAGRRGRLTTLRELILAGNPLRETEFATGKGDKFQNEIARRFPSLEILDGHVFIRPTAPEVDPSTSATGAAANIPVATSFPVTMQPGSIDPNVQGIVGQFCTQFFDRFDNLRADLQYVYAPEATLSFSVNTSIPPRAKVQGWHTHPSMPHQRKLEWGKWFEARSRNLSRIREPEQFAKALCTGIAEIGEGLARIPPTKHDLSQPNHFVVDASAIDSGVLMVVVHGQFTEVETQGVRSFDRTFVLAPAAFGSPAQQHGWPVQIVSDLWVIRGYSHSDVWTPGAKLLAQDEAARGATFSAQNGTGFTASAPAPVAAQPPVAPAGPTPETIFAALPAEDQALVSTVTDVARRNTLLAFCARSGLRVMFAGQALEGNGWDPEAAWANFQTVRAQLGPESFISQ